MAPVALHKACDCSHARLIPDVGAREVNDHVFWVFVDIEEVAEVGGCPEKHGPLTAHATEECRQDETSVV